MIEYLSFTEKTQAIVRRLTDVAFLPESAALVAKLLANPLRRIDPDAGDLAVENGVTISFQAAIARKVVFEGRKIPAMTGGMLSSVPGTDPTIIFEIVEKSTLPRAGSVFYFGNTACKAALRLNKLRGISGVGPDSCAAQRLQPIHWMRFAWYMFLHKVFHRPNLGGKEKRYQGGEKFDGLDEFWQRYVKNVTGLCSSRTLPELRWAFGEDKYVILRHGDDKVDGYIVLKSDDTGNRWAIADWIALNNDEKILEDLLVAAKRFLKRKTHAMLFQTTGFPTFVQPILARHFKYSRPLNSNEFLYRFDDAALKEKVLPLMDTKESWFFGPYDGDACLF